MHDAQTMPGKKVKLEVYQGDADALREKGQEFFQAMQGQVVQEDGQVVFGNVIMMVKATKPKGPVEIGKYTAIKMSLSKKPVSISCPHCGREQAEARTSCQDCGQGLPVVEL